MNLNKKNAGFFWSLWNTYTTRALDFLDLSENKENE